MNPKVVLINGKKRSGKDWTADKIKDELNERGYSVKVMSFAQPMKTIVSKTFGISEDQLDEYKNDTELFGIEIKVYPNNQPQGTLHYVTFREILQWFGTEAMKPIFGDDVWASLLFKQAKESDVDFVLVPDFRFLIEYDESALTLKIRNDEIEAQCTDRHASETELDNFVFDYEIDNTGYRDTTDDVSEFCDKLERIK